ncbi:MAG: heme ABC exporter ATP-binding protein CcmA [Chloroflexi bacterium]|nr:heme ABC exporter ATP-binding protein CcmA [Chloroflexota bacterium]
MNTASPAIAVQGLGKRYGPQAALKSLDLAVAPGERLAVFGPNGSGKTTLLRILSGLTRQTKGEFTIAGMDYRRDGMALRQKVGVVAHHPYLYEDLSAEENLRFYGRMFGLADPAARAEALLAQVGLAARRRDKARTFSRGMQQRLALARALLHDPDILLMDEPDTGLDQEGSHLIQGLLHREGAPRTVVMATHNLALGRAHCLRFLILAAGRIAHQSSLENIGTAELQETYQRYVTAR